MTTYTPLDEKLIVLKGQRDRYRVPNKFMKKMILSYNKKKKVSFMKIYVKNDDGKVYEAFQVGENTYKFKTRNKTFELSLSAPNESLILVH